MRHDLDRQLWRAPRNHCSPRWACSLEGIEHFPHWPIQWRNKSCPLGPQNASFSPALGVSSYIWSTTFLRGDITLSFEAVSVLRAPFCLQGWLFWAPHSLAYIETNCSITSLLLSCSRHTLRRPQACPGCSGRNFTDPGYFSPAWKLLLLLLSLQFCCFDPSVVLTYLLQRSFGLKQSLLATLAILLQVILRSP